MKIIYFFLLLVTYSKVEALRCYTCSVTLDDIDQTCLTDPEKAGITNCDKKYCISMRVDFLDPKDALQSLTRNCVDTPVYLNEVIEDETFRTYYKSCQTDLCNGGSGRDLSEPTSNIDGEAMTLFIPGRGSGYTIVVSTSFIIFLQFLLLLYYM